MDLIPPGTDLSTIPLAANPHGGLPNFTDPVALVTAIRGVSITFAIVALCFVVTRILIYTQNRRPFGLDDACVIFAMMLSASYVGAMSSGLGAAQCRHAWDTPLSFFDKGYAKVIFIVTLWYGPMLFFAKSSILLLYLRVFQRKLWLKVSVYTTLIILFFVYWMTVPLTFIYCMPHKGETWGLETAVRCAKLSVPGFVQGGINIAADIFIFALPLPIISKLQIPLKKKIGIMAVFATGLLALISSVLAMVYRVRVAELTDSTYTQCQVWVSIQSELNATIYCACMPSLSAISKTDFSELRVFTNTSSKVRDWVHRTRSSNYSRSSSNDHASMREREHHDDVHSIQNATILSPSERKDAIYTTTTFGVLHNQSSGSSQASTIT